MGIVRVSDGSSSVGTSWTTSAAQANPTPATTSLAAVNTGGSEASTSATKPGSNSLAVVNNSTALLQQQLADAKRLWWDAAARNDQDAMNAAHSRADALRSQGALENTSVNAQINAEGQKLVASSGSRSTSATVTSAGSQPGVTVQVGTSTRTAGTSLAAINADSGSSRLAPTGQTATTQSGPTTGKQLPIERVAQGYPNAEKKPWTDMTLGNTTVGREGCFVASYTMAQNYLNNTPKGGSNVIKTLAVITTSKAVDDNGNLTPESADPLFGLHTEEVKDTDGLQGKKTLTAIKRAIDENKPVIVGGAGGNGTHYAVVTGYQGTAKETKDFLVQDPGSVPRHTLEDFRKDYPTLTRVYTAERAKVRHRRHVVED